MDGFFRGEIRTCRRRQHQPFAQERRIRHKHGDEDHGEKKQIGQAFDLPIFTRRIFFALGAWRPARIILIHKIKNGQQQPDAQQPHRPAIRRDPPERDALQKTEEQRRVADRREAAAGVRDDKNKKHDVMRRHAGLIHADPRADQQHGRAGGAKDIGQKRAAQQK
jgi:hypothetical protein